MRYTYLGDSLTADHLRGMQCDPVRRAGDDCLLLIPYATPQDTITAIVQNLNRIVNTYGKMLDADGSRITVPLEEDANG